MRTAKAPSSKILGPTVARWDPSVVKSNQRRNRRQRTKGTGDLMDEAERARRRRVMHGWAFKDLPKEEEEAVRAYLDGGPVPEGYEALDQAVKGKGTK